MSCPASRSGRVCAESEDFGPCYECEQDLGVQSWMRGVDGPDYVESRLDAMAKAIRKLEGTVRHLSAALRAASK